MTYTDADLQAMPICERNRVLDELEAEAADAAQAQAEWEAEQRYEAWLENGGAHADVIAWEHQQDELRALPW